MQNSEDIDAIVNQLGSDSVAQKNQARDKVLMIGKPAIPHLEKAIKQGSAAQAAQAVILLGEMKSVSSVDVVCEALRHENPRVRESAAKTLGELGDTRAVDDLIDRLTQDMRLIQVWIIESLGVLGDQRAVPHLMKLLETTDNPQIMYLCIRALTALNAKEALDLIVTFKDFPEHHVQFDVSEAIKRLS